MHRIEKYVNKLIAQHECVMIPSFGAIIKETIPPRYIPEEGMVYPCVATYHFNPELKDRDLLLDRLYAQTFSISLRRAKLMVDRDVEDLRNILFSSRSFKMGILGEFRLDEKQTVLFIPNKKQIFNYGSGGEGYGLTPCPLPLAVSLSEEEKQNPASTENKKSEYIHFKIHKNRAKNVAAALLLGGILLIPTLKEDHSNQYSAGVVNGYPVSSVSSFDAGTSPQVNEIGLSDYSPFIVTKKSFDTQKEIVSLLFKGKTNRKETASDPALSTTSPQQYYIIVGAFLSENKVHRFMETYSASNPSQELHYFKHNNRYLVYIHSTNDKQESLDFLRRFHKENNTDKDAWILHISSRK